MTGPRGLMRGLPQAPTERSSDFAGSARRLVGRLRPHRGPAALVIMLGIAGIAIGVIGPRILGHATDLLFDGVIGATLPAGLTKEQAVDAARVRGDTAFADLLSGMAVVPGRGVDFGAVGRTLAVALALYLVAALFVWIQARILNVIIVGAVAELRADVEAKLHRLPLSYFDTRRRGEVLSRVTNDVDNVATALAITVGQLLTSLLTIVAVVVMMLTISPLLTLITVLTLPLSLLATRWIAQRSRRLFVAQWRNTGRLSAHIEETYSGFTVVKTYGHRAHARQQFGELNDELYRASLGAQFFSGLVAPATGFIGNLGYVAVAVLGGVKVATGQVTLGSIQAFIQYVRQFNQPLAQVASMYNTLQSGIASAERVFELLDEPELPADPPRDLPPAGGRVQFEHVRFGYRPDVPVLQDVSLIAEPGTTVAIVGPTGAGKTTLVNLLMRFYEPDSGRILVDGVDIAAVSRHSLRARIGMVLQDTWLFSGTVYDNIAYGRPGAGTDEVYAAGRAAHVEDFVHTLPDGYQTRVHDDGGAISAGEKQLITIARALLARPQLLILDEATSSVDTRTEVMIAHAMAELRRNRTTFLIAHRLSTIRAADQILVLDGGRILERGGHAELMALRGRYWAMTQA